MINGIIYVIILLCEILLVLQCLQVTFRYKIHIDIYTVLIVLLYVLLYLMINIKLLPPVCSGLAYVLFLLYCHVEFKQTPGKTIIGFVTGFILTGCFEGISVFFINFLGYGHDSIYILLISSVMSLVIAFMAKRYVYKKRNRKKLKGISSVVIIIIFIITVLKLLTDYYFHQKSVNIYVVFLLILLVMILGYLYRIKLVENELEKKNYELKLQEIYGGAYKKLIEDIRRRQHDFKNQLSAIYSMHLVAKSLDELIIMQNEYVNTLRHDSKFDSILTSCNNVILAGYLYQKCLECEQQEISVDYNIHIVEAECRFALHEIIELLGILIDNACEYCANMNKSYKKIKITFTESDTDIIIGVSNPTKYISHSEIEKMFVRGFSTKGENRGLGLARALELTQKYNAKLKVCNTSEHNDNWIEFIIEIEK